VLDAYQAHIGRLEQWDSDGEVQRLGKHLKRDGYVYQNGRIESLSHEPALEDLIDENSDLDLSQLRVNIARVRSSIDDDPALAVGSAKELVEATCKAILTQARIPIPEDA